jgi:hypothetical protein
MTAEAGSSGGGRTMALAMNLSIDQYSCVTSSGPIVSTAAAAHAELLVMEDSTSSGSLSMPLSISLSFLSMPSAPPPAPTTPFTACGEALSVVDNDDEKSLLLLLTNSPLSVGSASLGVLTPWGGDVLLLLFSVTGECTVTEPDAAAASAA